MTNRIRDIDWSQFELRFDAEENPIIILKRTGKPIPTHMINNRYLAICVKETNNLLFHRAVWFLNEIAQGRTPNQDVEIHHKDENKLNNKLSNLEALTATEHRRLHELTQKRLAGWKRKWNTDPAWREQVIQRMRRTCQIRVEKCLARKAAKNAENGQNLD